MNVAVKSTTNMKPRVVLGDLTRTRVCRVDGPLIVNSEGVLRQTGSFISDKLVVRAMATRRVDRVPCGRKMMRYLSLSLLPRSLPVNRMSPRTKSTTFRCLTGTVRVTGRGQVSTVYATPLGGRTLRGNNRVCPNRARVLTSLASAGSCSVVLSTPGLEIVRIAARIKVVSTIGVVGPREICRILGLTRSALGGTNVRSPGVTIYKVGPRTNRGKLFKCNRRRRGIVPKIRGTRTRKVGTMKPLPTSALFFETIQNSFSVIMTVCRSRKRKPIGMLKLSTKIGVAINLPVVHADISRNATFSVTKGNVTSRGDLVRTVHRTMRLTPGGG